ncbi:MAG: BolA/IbaG family iron-sulfur metabolism protein [Alphaproteobacteria bacterium]
MPMSADEIVDEIKKSFPDAVVEMTDLAGDGDHWAAVVKSSQFTGLSRIQQHKLVYSALGDKMGDELHALQLKTLPLD